PGGGRGLLQLLALPEDRVRRALPLPEELAAHVSWLPAHRRLVRRAEGVLQGAAREAPGGRASPRLAGPVRERGGEGLARAALRGRPPRLARGGVARVGGDQGPGRARLGGEV